MSLVCRSRLSAVFAVVAFASTIGACGGDSGEGTTDTLDPDTSSDTNVVTDTLTGDGSDTADTAGDTTTEDTSNDATDTSGDATDTTGDATDTTGDTAGDATDTTGDTQTGDTADDTAGDTQSGDTASGDASGDTTGDTAGDTSDPCSATPSPAGCACGADADCDSGFCAIGAEGSYCVQTCSGDNDCGGVGKCVVGTEGGDGVCLLPSDFLCAPCRADADCRRAGGTGKCLSFGSNGSFCGETCSGDGDCPEEFGCVQGQCVPDSGTCGCSDIALELGASTNCTLSNSFGTCTGERFCGAGGLTACNARTPAKDICNGVDDDCNATPDDAAGNCDDSNVCTKDQCNGAAGCANTPQAGTCSDGDSCTSFDTCVNGTCQGTPSCACQNASDCTTPPPGKALACVTPSCNSGACVYAPKTGSCNDGDACTLNDTCNDGACGGTAKNCDDGNPCTNDSCLANGTCSNVARTGSCEDGNPCTTNDVCTGGICGGTALNCSNLDDACHIGVCDGNGGCLAQTIACGASKVRLHVPAGVMSKKGTGATWLRGSIGQSLVGLSSNGVHKIRFGFHPGTRR